MEIYLFSIIFAAFGAALLELSLIPLSKTQIKFQNKIFRYLKHAKLFTIFKLLWNKFFILFLSIIIPSFISIGFMIWFSISETGVLIITPYLIFILFLLLFSKPVEKHTYKIYQKANLIKPPPKLDLKNIMLSNKFRDLNELQTCFNKIYELLLLNLSEPFGRIKTRFATPSPKYPAAYLWDSAFISQVWKHWDIGIAKEILMPFLDFQLENGLCPQTISLGLFPNYKITNPPLLSWALMEIAESEGNYNFLEPIYPKLKKFNEFFYRERRKGQLFAWKHSYESGIDNTPRFTDQSEKFKCNIEEIWAVDLNTWMVLDLESLSKIAKHLNFKEDEQEFLKKSGELKSLINRYLWDEETGLYYDYNYIQKHLVKIPTLFSIFPMLCKIPDSKQAGKIILHIKNIEEFNTLIPFPTVARNSSEFQKDCWRGPVWINTAYMGIKCLKMYSENNLAQDLCINLINGVVETFSNEGSIYEFYDPDDTYLDNLTRKKGNLIKQITLGSKPVNKFVGWSGLLNSLIFEEILKNQ